MLSFSFCHILCVLCLLQLYRQLNIYIVLVGVEVWSTGDKIGITSSADTTMENFLRYRKERINPYHPNDNAQLIT